MPDESAQAPGSKQSYRISRYGAGLHSVISSMYSVPVPPVGAGAFLVLTPMVIELTLARFTR